MQKTKFVATLKERVKLNTDENSKNIYHLTLCIEPSDLCYKSGSCIAIHPKNPDKIVNHLLDLLKIQPHESIVHPKSGNTMSAHCFFENHVNLHQTRSSLVKELYPELSDNNQVRSYCQLDFVTFLEKSQDRIDKLESILVHAAPLLPRYYSISSSQKTNKNQLDLMVSTMDFDHEHIKVGITSGYLTKAIEIGDEVVFSYHENEKFCLPEQQETPIIMIGPGTGFAPFRGFLQELQERKNPAWLFTGAQNSKHHFYYKDEFEVLKNSSHLRFEHAFSRDQENKIYVQHLIQENGQEFIEWLESGALVYICGDAKKMARDVQSSIKDLLVEHKGLNEADAKSYLKEMRRSGRLNLDVY
jgi:sulfite reductase (NADPH) flavoprotein alpha-component